MRPDSFLGRLVVNLTVILICFISYSSQIFIIWPWYGRVVSVPLITLLVPFNFFVGMLFWNYFLCVFTDPGGVPDSWKPDASQDGYEVKKLTGGPRYCRACEKYKPPRAHHCRQCDRCVLRMDHHCPWVNNCVGHFNYGYFIRFLCFVDIACAYHLAMVTRRVLDETSSSYWNAVSGIELVFIMLNYVTCVPVMLAVGGFSLYHISSLMSNTTTIESWEKDRATMMVKRGKLREMRFPYHLGRLRNVESVLGTKPLLWLWPMPAPGDGLRYDINHTEEGHELSEWPPRDYTTTYQPRQEDGTGFDLPDSPWTYGNSINPELEPSNSKVRSANRRVKRPVHHSTLPPYHPDYQEGASSGYDYEESDSSLDEHTSPRTKIRRGSEGYEVRTAGREDMLQRYLQELGETPGRYHQYIPEPDSEESEEDATPIAQIRREKDRVQ